MTNETDMSVEELAARVVFAMLAPSVAIARSFRTPLGRMKELVDMAYFEKLKEEGLKMREMVDVLDVSMSKVALLSRQLKENFLDTQRTELTRRIEFMLWAGPLSKARIDQVLVNESAKDIESALSDLIEGSTVHEIQGDRTLQYELLVQADRRERDTWLARIDGLNHALETVGLTIFSRFFAPEIPAFARTLSFRVRADDFQKLQEAYERLFEVVQELDSDADEEAVEVQLSLFWSQSHEMEQPT